MSATATAPLLSTGTRRTPPRWGAIDATGAKYFPCHAGQSDILRSKARFTAAIAGTGGGKTAVGPVWLMQQINRVLAEVELNGRDLRSDPILGMVVAPTYKVLARATVPHLVTAFRDTEFEGTYVPSTSQYILPHDLGIIWVLSADNPGGLEGGQFDFVWMDEGGQMKFNSWVAVQGRTGLREAPVLITTTPYGQNWLFHVFFKKWKKGDKNYFVRQWSSFVNPAYPRAEYDRAKRDLSPQRAAMRYDGEFVKRAGLVYPDLDRCVIDPNTFPTPGGELIGGLDWGWNDPFAGLCAVRYIDEEGRDVLYVWYERYKRFTGLAAHAEALPPDSTYHADPSRPDSINELRKAGHTVRPAYNGIIVGVDAVNARIYSDRLKISKECRALLAEANEYCYPEKDDETHGENPVDEFNHACDALRYLVAGADKLRVATSNAEHPRKDDDDGDDNETSGDDREE